MFLGLCAKNINPTNLFSMEFVSSRNHVEFVTVQLLVELGGKKDVWGRRPHALNVFSPERIREL